MAKSPPESQDTEDAKLADHDAPAKKPRRKLILAAVALIAISAVAGGAYFVLGADSSEAVAEEPSESDDAEAKTIGDGEAAAIKEKYAVAPFKEIIVNISSITINGQASSRFLKLNVALVYDPAAEGAERIAERQIYIRDSFVEFLRQLTERDLNGSAGLAFLKSELLHRVRLLSESDAPRELLIADLVIQ